MVYYTQDYMYNMDASLLFFYTEEDSSRDPTPDFTLQNFWSKLGKYGIFKYSISLNYPGCLQKYKLACTLYPTLRLDVLSHALDCVFQASYC